ncbi:MAG: efflux transporter outer membrane subunit [Planctomycetota bacterium]|jgi:multidrug efflux system outer membrane protein
MLGPRLLIPLLLAPLLGCGGGPSYIPERDRPELPVPDSFGIGSPEQVQDGWIASFGDETLESLVIEALSNNPDLAAAAARVDQAAGFAKKAGALLEPTVSLGAGAYGGGTGEASGPTGGGVGLSFDWELDVWGRLSAGAEAAREDYLSAVLLEQYARQSLAAQVAKGWFQLTEIQLQSRLAQQVVDLQQEILTITEAQLQQGAVAQTQVDLARAAVASANEALRSVQGAFNQAQRSLEVLLGRYPSGELAAADDFVAVPPAIPAGLPSDLLERRMDIVAAERQVAASYGRLDMAKAAKLPRVAITADGGAASSDFSSLLNPANIAWNSAANLLAPIFDGGRRDADVEIANAQQEAAVAEYRSTALQAFAEVETGLENDGILLQREQFLDVTLDSNQRTYEVAQAQLEAGRIDRIQELQVQARVLNARVARISIRGLRLMQRVDLHLSLGGNAEATSE